MATSSIFHQVRISDPKQAEAFADALEKSARMTARASEIRARASLSDREAIRNLMGKKK